MVREGGREYRTTRGSGRSACGPCGTWVPVRLPFVEVEMPTDAVDLPESHTPVS